MNYQQQSLSLSTLVDSDVEGYLLDEDIASWAGIPREPLNTPLQARALDGKLLAWGYPLYATPDLDFVRKPSRGGNRSPFVHQVFHLHRIPVDIISDRGPQFISQYLRPVNPVYARHRLATRKQRPTESTAEFLRDLQALARTCDCQALTAEQHTELLVRDAFVTGVRSVCIRQRLLEKADLTLRSAIETADTIEAAQLYAEEVQPRDSPVPSEFANAAASRGISNPSNSPGIKLCYFCGLPKHPRNSCPAREATCSSCGKKGHFAKEVCHWDHPTSLADVPGASAAT
ncbi:uncharacterized protein [Hemitrygon akajei]|uniref:uncharacterized protein n=1 Tax=Hemitrygon akajei TaxID=2704970 RepID=UPI003BF9486A